MIETSRRSLIIGLSTLIAAPAIVRASSLMKVKPLLPPGWVVCGHWVISDVSLPFETAFPRVPRKDAGDWKPILNVDGRIITQDGFVYVERILTSDSTGSAFPAGTVGWL